MSILKSKIALTLKLKNKPLLEKPSTLNIQSYSSPLVKIEEETDISQSPPDLKDENLKSTSPSSSTSEGIQLKKTISCPDSVSPSNIMKNYCRGIVCFVLSRIAITYIKPLLQKQGLTLQAFNEFIRLRRKKLNCIKQLREIILIKPNDRKEVAIMKEVFKEACIIFLKYFSPNWIYNSNITNKYAHIKYRFKILRRVKNPHLFTYLKGFD